MNRNTVANASTVILEKSWQCSAQESKPKLNLRMDYKFQTKHKKTLNTEHNIAKQTKPI